MSRALLCLLVLSGCPKKTDQMPTSSRIYDAAPEALSPRPFLLPQVSEGTLSNGIKVAVVENHEVPLVYVRVILESGSWTDPSDQPGLASATVDLMNEGAGEYSSDELSRALRVLASDLTTGAGLDGSAISLKSLKENLPASLDLMATVTLEPTFPQPEWELSQARRIQDVKAIAQDPRSISGRAWSRLMYGTDYAGQLSTVPSYEAMTTDDMRGWYSDHVTADNATILVGGDTTLSEVLPLLEARFSSWEPGDSEPVSPPSGSIPAAVTGQVYLIDKPGAAQSIVRLGQVIGDRQAPDAAAFELANMAIGGQFTARINMNLREDKGWTYGASAWIGHNHYPGSWNVYTSLVTQHTADGLREILAEIAGMSADAPVTAAELAAGRGDLLGSWPVRFEQPGYLLDRTVDVRRYGLPSDWMANYPDRLRAVTLDQAQQAWLDRIDPDQFIILVVGDAAMVRAPLEGLGLSVVQLGLDGAPLNSEQ
ncbi:MAG: zinc protease [Myxococcota bacterium]